MKCLLCCIFLQINWKQKLGIIFHENHHFALYKISHAISEVWFLLFALMEQGKLYNQLRATDGTIFFNFLNFWPRDFRTWFSDIRVIFCSFSGGLDLIILPGLGFSVDGDRLGRGMGYYDSYQRRCMELKTGKPYAIALAYKEQMCDTVPTSDDDITVDQVLFGDWILNTSTLKGKLPPWPKISMFCALYQNYQHLLEK